MRPTLLLPALLLLALLAPATASADLRSCGQSDRANGISRIQVDGVTCREGLAVARRTNSVKCFLNGPRCTHTFRGRRWTCRLIEGASRPPVRCAAGTRRVHYRLG